VDTLSLQVNKKNEFPDGVSVVLIHVPLFILRLILPFITANTIAAAHSNQEKVNELKNHDLKPDAHELRLL